MGRAFAAIALAATASFAHAPMKTRALRLQLQRGQLEGLLELHVPAAAAAPYEAAADLRVALAPAALEGLHLGPLLVKVAEASVRKNPDGSLDASFLLAPQPAPARLRISVEAGLPLPIELIAETGLKLTLRSGPGAPVAGGLSLRPRPGVPCDVSVAATGTPRSR